MVEQQSILSSTLRAMREARDISRPELGRRTGFSVETIRSFEIGRRDPNHDALGRVADALGLSPVERRRLFAAADDATESTSLMQPLRELRARVEGTQAELERYEWTALLVNERHEVYGWNELANAVAEADLEELVPTPMERSLLWLAGLDHIAQRLTNWEEIIGRLVTIFRLEGVALDRGAPPPPYLQALIARLMAAGRGEILDRFTRLWFAPETWRQGQRNLHPIEWRLADGTELSFVGAFHEWSTFDGSFLFDWLPANRTTGDWMTAALDRVGRAGYVPGVSELEEREFGEWLASEREALAMSIGTLAKRSRLSESSVRAYEHGTRTPRRDAVVRLARALALDGFTANVWLESLGFSPEPSDLARAICGIEAYGIRAGYSPDFSVPQRVRLNELVESAWPSFMLNGICEVEAANDLGSRLVGLPGIRQEFGDSQLHLVEFMISPQCRERMLNWPEVARAVVPNDLRPIVLGYRNEKPVTALTERLLALGRRHRQSVAALVDAWEDAPDGPAPRRVAVPIEWVHDNGDVLRFHCFIYGWNGYDPNWSVDWHPANAAAWDAIERIAEETTPLGARAWANPPH